MWAALRPLLLAQLGVALRQPSWESKRATFLWDAQPTVEPTFNNTLLVVHCRLKGRLPSELICAEREPLFDGYRKYFAEVLFMTREDCPVGPGDPHLCIAKLMEDRAANRDGIFYVHFDSLIRPRHLAQTFEKLKMYSFSEDTWCEINKTTLLQEHCICNFWAPMRAVSYQKAIEWLRKSGWPEFANLDPWQFWIANDDLFYVPQSLFSLYVPLAEAFRGVHHEIAGPTMRVILKNITSVPQLNLGCSGSCCTKLPGAVALAPSFKCGHAFDLAQEQTRDAFPTAISTHRRMPMESWKQIVQQALL